MTPANTGSAASDPPSVSLGALRVSSVDLYRGLIMVIMLLDHTRERVHLTGMVENPTNPATTTALLFFTRWITHLCAPGFVFLAGTSAGLLGIKGLTKPELARYLVKRGLALILIEILLVRPLALFNVHPSLLFWLETIFAIGSSMIALAALIFIPQRILFALGLLIVCGHNLLDSIRVGPWFGPQFPIPTFTAKLWMIVHQGGFFPVPLYNVAGLPGPVVFANYPILPWIGVIVLGYCTATIFTWPAKRRVRALAFTGASMIVLFIVIRALNIYGDTTPWKAQETSLQALFSFLNLQKYPPSLLFLLATLAPCLLTLALVDGKPLTSRVSEWFMTFGRVPMFFFLIQWPYVHAAGAIVTLAYGLPLTGRFSNILDYVLGPQPPNSGGPMWTVYVAWIVGALLLYFPCRWYANLRAQRRDIVLLRYI